MLGDDAKAAAVALDRVVAWRRRGRLPLGVDVTSSLVSTCLRDPVAPRQHLRPQLGQASPEWSLQSEYSLTLIRFVNGVSDSTQKGKVATSVSKHAEFAGLHPMLVDVRHEATHNNLPSLHTLRLAAAHALAWLQLNYWESQVARLAECSEHAVRIVLNLVENQTARLAISGKPCSEYSSASDSEDTTELHVDVVASEDAPSAAGLKKQQRSLLGDLRQVVPASQPTVLAAAVLKSDIFSLQNSFPPFIPSPSPQKKQKQVRGKMRNTSTPIAVGSQLRAALVSTVAVLDTVWSSATRYIVKECVNIISEAKRSLLRTNAAPRQPGISQATLSSTHAAIAWFTAALKACDHPRASSCVQQVAQHALQNLFHRSLLLEPVHTRQNLPQDDIQKAHNASVSNLAAFYRNGASESCGACSNGRGRRLGTLLLC